MAMLLILAQKLKKRDVINIVKEMKKNWGQARWIVKKDKNLKESNLLQLNSNKAKKFIGWNCKLDLKQSVSLTAEWYKIFYNDRKKLKIYQLLKFKNLIN